MLQPSRTKYRKAHKGRNNGLAFVANKVSFGEYGLKAVEHGQLTARQIEAARRTISLPPVLADQERDPGAKARATGLNGLKLAPQPSEEPGSPVRKTLR